MSDVVLRCPNCGTTQSTLGECDACHDAEARYFCPNHTPGRWIDGPTCAACGARFTGRAHTSPPSAPPTRAASPARAGTAPAPGDGTSRPVPPRVRRVPPPVEPEVVEAEWVEREPAPWPPVGRGRRTTTGPPELPFPVVRVGVGSVLGCLARLAMLAVVVVVLVGLWFFGYCGASPGVADGGHTPSSLSPRPTRIVRVSDAMMPGAHASRIAHAPGGANRETG